MSKRGDVLVIYADVVFLINLIMDTFILFLTSIILKKRIRKTKIFISGLIGSLLYCFLMFYEPITKFYNPTTSLSTFVIPIVFLFKPKDIREFLRPFIVLNICAFFIGGVASAIFFYSNANRYIGELIVFTVDNFSLKLLLFSCSATYVSIKIARIIFLEKIIQSKRIVNVEIKNGEKRVCFFGLVDTGNTLKEPQTDAHIIIAEFDAIKDFLPDEIRLCFYEKRNIEDFSKYIVGFDNEMFSIVPFKSIGNESGSIFCFKIDEAYVHDEKDECYERNIYIGVADFQLSGGEYSALVNPEIFSSNIKNN